MLGRNTVRCQKVYRFFRGESSVSHSDENLVWRVKWCWYEAVGGRKGFIASTSEEFQSGTTGAIGYAYRPCKLDAKGLMRLWSAAFGWLTHKSPNDTLCFKANGRCSLIISSSPWLAADSDTLRLYRGSYSINQKRTEVGLYLLKSHNRPVCPPTPPSDLGTRRSLENMKIPAPPPLGLGQNVVS